MQSDHASEPVKVSTLELFFDLIFVFTITQLTELVIEAHTVVGWLQIPLVLAIIWWMYSGYVWLTNNTNLAHAKTRVLILLAMAGFLVIALAIPSAFDRGGLAFALAYSLVTLIHLGLFTQASNVSSAQAIWLLAPYNLGACLCLLAAAFLENPFKAWLWALAFLILISSSFLRRERSFVLSAGHFSERHGLVILIALGESVVGIGVGAKRESLDVPLILACLLGLILSAGLWWIYFDRDDTRGERALSRAGGQTRARIALFGYGYAHAVLILGIVISAAGIKQVISQLHSLSQTSAWSLGVGVALYLLGQIWFRYTIGITLSQSRVFGVFVALVTIPIGLYLGGFTQVTALVIGLLTMMAFDKKTRGSLNQ
jgi:low temperature requirement protein LtrA